MKRSRTRRFHSSIVMNDPSPPRPPLPRSVTGRGIMWLIYGSILIGASAVAALPDSPAGPVLRFERSVTAGSSLTLAERHSLELRSLVLEVGDEKPTQSSVSLHLWSGALSYLVDEIDTRTGLLCRRYDRSKGVIQSGQIDPSGQELRGPEMPLVSPLEDIGVAFTPKTGAPHGYARHYDSAKTLNESLLPRLAPPRDWGVLLPPSGPDGAPKAVELGAQWDVAPADMECALSPTGDMLFLGGEGMDARTMRAFSNGVGGSLHLGFGGSVDGTAKARLQLQGVDPVDGAYVDIEIEFDLSISADRSEFIKQNRAEAMAGLDGEVLAMSLEQGLRGKTKLRWSLETDGPISCATECHESLVMAVQMAGLDGTPRRQTVAMDGDLMVTATFDPVSLRRSARSQ